MKKKYLITAVAGTGKSTVAKELSKMKYESYDIEDIDGMFGMYRKDTGKLYEDFDNADPEKIKNGDWLCNVDTLKEVLYQQKSDSAFYCGVASNMDDILHLFDKVFLLVTDKEKLHKRLSNREGSGDIGTNEESRQAVLGWKEWWEDEMRKKGVIEVDARGVPGEIANKILTLIG